MYGSGWENYDKLEPIEPVRATTAARFTVNSVTDGIIVPGLKSLILAVPAGLLAGLAIGAFGWQINAWYAIPGVGLVVFITVFWRSSAWWNNVLERMLGIDLNKDNTIAGVPIPQPVNVPPASIRVELIQDEGRKGDYIDLPYPERLPQLAETILGGRTFAQTTLVGTGKLYSRGEYDTLVAALINSGLARWKNPDHHNQGWEPSVAGKAVLKRFVKHSPALPSGDDA